MALRIEDVTSLPGRGVVDQEGEDVGEIQDVYGIGDDGDPMWVSIEISTGGVGGEDVLRFLPLARLRDDGKEKLSVPYSVEHIENSPEVEAEDDEISEDDDNKLRVYYSVDLADQEFRNEPQSYAAQVPEGGGPATKVTDDLDDKELAGGHSEDGSSDEDEESEKKQDRSKDSDDSEDDEQKDEDTES
jgi:sporulation protein YlmC with PRC-barrel domain